MWVEFKSTDNRDAANGRGTALVSPSSASGSRWRTDSWLGQDRELWFHPFFSVMHVWPR